MTRFREAGPDDGWGTADGEDAFVDLYRCQRDGLVRLAYLLTASQAAAEDIVQDAFIRSHDKLAGVERPAAYLRRAVTNGCWSWHRRARRETEFAADGPAVVGGGSDIEMWDALNRLSTRRRSVLILRYYLDLSEAETAETLGWRVGTVKSTTHRALADLRRMVDP